MSLWGNLDAANNAPKSSGMPGYGGSTPQVTSNAQVYYANTQLGSFSDNQAIGIFGVSASEMANAVSGDATQSTGKPPHAGWVTRRVGMGPVISITANAGAVGVNSTITIVANSGFGNTGSNGRSTIIPVVATITTNTAGYISTITIVNPGMYANTPILRPNTGNAVFTVTMGGRANRVQTDTLVAMGSMTGDNENVF
jgi:hypothetical protein